jgi:hypothetical protein
MISELLKPEELTNHENIRLLNKVIAKEKGLPNVDNKLDESDENKSRNINSNQETETNKKLQEMLGVDVNEETTSMINDIVGSFEKVLTNQSNPNPLGGIMEISQTISVKYADKINKGEIELDKLMQAITKKVPGMEQMMNGMMGGAASKPKSKEKILIDENFSTANINVGMNKEPESENNMNIASMLKMADQFGVIPGGKSTSGENSGIPGIGKVMDIMRKLENTNTKEDADALKIEMDSFLQKEMGVDVNKLNEQLEIVTKQMESNKTETTQTQTQS